MRKAENMYANLKDALAYTGKVAIFLIYQVYRAACGHPFVFGMVLFMLLLYRVIPDVFGILVSSSPIIICTVILLGVLLSFGQPNVPEIEEEKPTSQVHAIADGQEEEEHSFFVERQIQNQQNVEDAATAEEDSVEPFDYVDKPERGVLLSAPNEEEEGKTEIYLDTALSFLDPKQVHTETVITKDQVIKDTRQFEVAVRHEPNSYQDVGNAFIPAMGRNTTENFKVETDKAAIEGHLEGHLDLSISSPWELVDNHGSDIDSDHAESFSGASMEDVIPMLEEIHPLLDSADSHLDLHSISGASTEAGESDAGSGVEEHGNQGEGEGKESKDDKEYGAVLAVKWTEEDAQNLLVLGTSEHERNQRVENLISKRKLRKNLSMIAEKDLIDLDANEIDVVFQIQHQILPISTARRNPFDLPCDSHENASLPPIPGSAPSVLVPRLNPLLPAYQTDEGDRVPGLHHQGFTSPSQRDMLFKRHESFSLGTSFTGDCKQDEHDTRLRPYFVAETTDSEEAGYGHFHRQFSEQSDSKVSSILEFETISVVADQDYTDEFPDKRVHQGSEYALICSPMNHTEHVKMEISLSTELNSVDSPCRNKEINACSSHEIDSSAFEVLGASIRDAVEDPRNHEGQDHHNMELCSPTSDAANTDVSEEKYCRSSSSSSELCMKNLGAKKKYGSSVLHQPDSGSSEGSSSSMHSTVATVDIMSGCHISQPVFYSSPSVDKYVSDMGSLEELLHRGKGGFDPTSSLPFETLVYASGIDSSMPSDGRILSEMANPLSDTRSMGALSASHSGEHWVAPSCLPCVEENKSISQELREIREHDPVQAAVTEDNDECEEPIASTPSELSMERSICYSTSRESESQSSEGCAMDMGGKQVSVVEAPQLDSRPSPKGLEAQPSFTTSYIEDMVGISYLNPKDVPEYFNHEKEYENASVSSMKNKVICSPKAQVSSASLSDIREESDFHRNFAEKTSDDTDANKEAPVPEKTDAFACLPGVLFPVSTDLMKVEVTRFQISSERTEVKEAERSLSQQDIADVEEVKGVYEEAFLSELDAIGDYHVEELNSIDNKSKRSQYNVSEKVVSEETSQMTSGPGDGISLETCLSLGERSNLQDIDARSPDNIHGVLNHFLGEPKSMKNELILGSQGTETRSSEGCSNIKVCDFLHEESSEHHGALNVQDVEVRSFEATDMASQHVTSCTDNFSPKLIDKEHDAAIMEATEIHDEGSSNKMDIKDSSDMEEIEAKSIADIDNALKNA